MSTTTSDHTWEKVDGDPAIYAISGGTRVSTREERNREEKKGEFRTRRLKKRRRKEERRDLDKGREV